MAAYSWEEGVWQMDAEEVGDLEPLSPGARVPTEAEPHDDDETDVEGRDEASRDGRGVVRVWVEDGRLAKVRVSPQWRARVGRGSLTESFAQALAFANATVAAPSADEEEASDDDADFSGLPPFDEQALAAFQTVFAEVEERWDQALLRHEERQPSSSSATLGKYKGVTVSLTPDGVATGVTFDKAWLESAQSETIGAHVMRAAEKAYATFSPGVDDRVELDDIAAEHDSLMAAFRAMVNPKERS